MILFSTMSGIVGSELSNDQLAFGAIVSTTTRTMKISGNSNAPTKFPNT